MFSIEALLCLAIIVTIIVSLPQNESFSSKEIIAKQKISDLLIISARNNYEKNEIVEAATLFLEGNMFEIELEGEKFGPGVHGEIISEEILMHKNEKTRKLKISISEN